MRCDVMNNRQVHNRHGTNGFINNNIKNKVYDHSVKTYEYVTGSKTHRYKDGDTAMSRLRELTLSGEEVHVSTSSSSSGGGGGSPSSGHRHSHSCQATPRLVDDYRLHLDSLLGEISALCVCVCDCVCIVYLHAYLCLYCIAHHVPTP